MLDTSWDLLRPSLEDQHDECVGHASGHKVTQLLHATLQNRNPNEAVLVHPENFKTPHMVGKPEQQLLNTQSMSQQMVTQLTICRSQLQKAQEKQAVNESCLRQREKDFVEMKLELVESKCRTREAMLNQKSLLGANASLTFYSLLLGQNEKELKNCESELLQLDAEEEELQTQVNSLEGEVQSLTHERFSISAKLQGAQNRIEVGTTECNELRKQLAQQIAANEAIQAELTMLARTESQILAGQQSKRDAILRTPQRPIYTRSPSPNPLATDSMQCPPRTPQQGISSKDHRQSVPQSPQQSNRYLQSKIRSERILIRYSLPRLRPPQGYC